MRSVRVTIVLTLAVAAALVAATAPASAAVRLWEPRLVPRPGSPGTPASSGSSTRAAYVPGQLLVEFKAGVSGARRRAVARGAAGVVSRRLPSSAAARGGALVLVSSDRWSTSRLQRELAADPAVAAVSPNYIRYVDTVPPDDPGLPGQWGLLDVGAGDAWQATTGSEEVVIADIDTGVDLLHPDLVGTLWTNPREVPRNGVDDDGNGYVDDVYGIDTAYGDVVPMDDDGHGTHTSGIAAARADNGVGVAGMGWRTRIMALKFITYWGGGTDAGAIECIDYAVRQKLEHGVNVVAINASWGGGAPSPFLRSAVQRAGDAGIVFVAAAGNTATDNDRIPHYPSSFDCDNILSVAATTKAGHLASFSNHGRTSVDLAAPGQDILSCVVGGGYDRWSGTSMATPFVSGVVALCAARFPDETTGQRIDRILAATRPVPDLAKKVRSGGTLDAAAALGLNGDDGTPPVTTPLGGDDGPYDVSVPVVLFAADDPGGSGVASTQWRLDGGAWRTGPGAAVPAPRRARKTRLLEFRSVDRAGNRELTQTVRIAFDTTARGSGVVALPASPVRGGVGGHSRDVYRLTLRAGETLTATSDGLSASSVALMVSTARPRPRLVDVWLPLRAPSYAFVAPCDGLYFLTVIQSDLWAAKPRLYSFSYELTPPGTDVSPPYASLPGVKGTWHNTPVEAEVVAGDGHGGSGVARVEQSFDDGLTWIEGARVRVDAPADHGNDGYHFLRYRAVDRAGNVGAVETQVIGIDTRGPSTQTWGPAEPVRRGAHATVRFRIDDLALKIRDCRLLVRSAETGRLVSVKRLGTRLTAGAVWWAPDHRHSTVVTCRWPAGAYTLRVTGFDPAGNKSTTTVCERPLVVK